MSSAIWNRVFAACFCKLWRLVSAGLMRTRAGLMRLGWFKEVISARGCVISQSHRVHIRTQAETDLASRCIILSRRARRLSPQFAGSLEHVQIVSATSQQEVGTKTRVYAAYWPLYVKISAICSLSHSSSLRTEKLKSSISCTTASFD
jgi:hypothetical protein